MKLNKNQKKISGLYIISLAVIVLFLPYLEVSLGSYSSAGYYFILAPPKTEGLAGIVTKYEIDFCRIFLEVIAATITAGILLLVLKKR